MSLNFAQISSGANYFKPEEHVDAAAILIEVNRFEHGVQTQFGPKDTVTADFTFFATQKDLEEGNGEELDNAVFRQTLLVRATKDIVGQATVVTLKQLPPRNGNRPAWVFDAAPKSAMQAVAKYVEKRDAQLKADMDDAPDF